jgi:hypothetical protein
MWECIHTTQNKRQKEKKKRTEEPVNDVTFLARAFIFF